MAGTSTNKLTAKQEGAIVALVLAPTISKAAATANVGERTLFRWLEDPIFKSAYRKARRQAFSHAISLTQTHMVDAVKTLARVMADDKAPHSAKVSAAGALMKFGRESIELDDVVERIEALEAGAKAAEGHGANGYGNGDFPRIGRGGEA